MSLRAYRLIFTSPSGEVFDVSDRLEIGQLGSISSTPETDLTVLTHGDMAMTLDDHDGAVSSFLENATPTDVYQVMLERQLAGVGSWVRLFGGMLDLPYSLSYDDKRKTAHVAAYGYTKKLERISADTIKRTFVGKTASITIDSATLVFISGETADLEVGDVVRLNDGQNRENFIVDRVISATNVATTEVAGRTFTGVYAEVTTQFYRDKSPAALLALIATTAGVTLNPRTLGSALADIPIATPFTIEDLNLSGVPQGLSPIGLYVHATFLSAYGTTRKRTTSPIVPWTDGATSNAAPFDWTPYLFTEPAALDIVGGAADTGMLAGNRTTGYAYHNLRSGNNLGLWRRLGAGADTALGTWYTGVAGIDMNKQWVEIDPTSARTFMTHNDVTIAGARDFFYWDGTFHAIDSFSGGLRCLRGSGGVTYILMVDDNYHLPVGNHNNLRIYDPAPTPPALVRIMPWGNLTDEILHWTFRTWGTSRTGVGARWMSVLFHRNNETWLRLYNAEGPPSAWSFTTEYKISSGASTRGSVGDGTSSVLAYTTVLVWDAGEELLAGFAGGVWFVLSPSYAGVVRYADFARSSCAKAAKDVAVIISSIVHTDEYGILSVLNRRELGSGVAADIGTPLTSTTRPNSEVYRSSVRVRGTDALGNAVDEVQGEQGDSARRVSIDSALISTPGMALACAIATLAFTSKIRRQRDVSVVDDGTPVPVFGRVKMDGAEWFVYKLETDLEQETHQMTLLEVLP
jgi:hypothetical protein